jgi:hypothetical protein
LEAKLSRRCRFVIRLDRGANRKDSKKMRSRLALVVAALAVTVAYGARQPNESRLHIEEPLNRVKPENIVVSCRRDGLQEVLTRSVARPAT